jgi:nitroimidazol reductase NimA-like FMN-containing flavoprotein (pyridoxamine 5'-phosphate oxidase superfamily)
VRTEVAALDLSLSPSELDAFLRAQRTARVATVDAAGEPQVVPLWFVWMDGALFLNSTRGNVTVRNALAPAAGAAAVIDDGASYEELRGVVLRGRVQEAGDDPRIADVDAEWSRKYLGGNPTPYVRWRNRLWLRLTPDHVSSWDFRRIPEAKARARQSEGSR